MVNWGHQGRKAYGQGKRFCNTSPPPLRSKKKGLALVEMLASVGSWGELYRQEGFEITGHQVARGDPHGPEMMEGLPVDGAVEIQVGGWEREPIGQVPRTVIRQMCAFSSS